MASAECTVIIADILDATTLVRSLNLEAGSELVHYFKVDLGSRESIEEFVGKKLEKWDRIDYLVNNAGVLTGKNSITYTKDGK